LDGEGGGEGGNGFNTLGNRTLLPSASTLLSPTVASTSSYRQTEAEAALSEQHVHGGKARGYEYLHCNCNFVVPFGAQEAVKAAQVEAALQCLEYNDEVSHSTEA